MYRIDAHGCRPALVVLKSPFCVVVIMYVSWLLGASLCLGSALAQAAVDNSCEFFSSNGLAAGQYQYYRFYDFRTQTPTQSASNTTKRQSSTSSKVKIVTGSTWSQDWYIRDFPRNAASPTMIPANFMTSQVYVGTCEHS